MHLLSTHCTMRILPLLPYKGPMGTCPHSQVFSQICNHYILLPIPQAVTPLCEVQTNLTNRAGVRLERNNGIALGRYLVDEWGNSLWVGHLNTPLLTWRTRGCELVFFAFIINIRMVKLIRSNETDICLCVMFFV